jgi:hypothetical protein
MNNKYYVGEQAKSITTGTQDNPISKVILTGENDSVFMAGDDTGEVFEVYVPNATQQMADDMLAKAKGFKYQGYAAEGVFLPPEAELGDGITLRGVYGILANREYSFTPKLAASIDSPYTEESEHEYSYEGTYAKDLARKVTLGNYYQGVKITKQNGIEIEKTDGENVTARAILNSEQIAFYNTNGDEAFVFDSASGIFRVTQYADIEDALSGSEAWSQMELTAESLQVQISNNDGDISSLQQTASSLQVQISNNDGDISSLQQTASSLQVQISNNAEDIASIDAYVDSITLSVSNASTSSTIQLKAGSTLISSQSISMSGLVTYTGLADGTTTIDGGCITTGTINANRLNLTGAIYWSDLSSGVQGEINDAYDLASNAYDLAESNEVPSYIHSTYISSTEIRSPEIYANSLYAYSGSSSGGFYLYGRFINNDYCMFSVEWSDAGTPYTYLDVPCGGTLVFGGSSEKLMFYGNVDFSHATVTGLS